ncbi:MAG: YciI family protein [Halopseudomonas aestusnigri]
MLYSFLIYSAEGIHDRLSPDEQEITLDQHRALQADLKESGNFATARLMPISNAITVKGQSDPKQKPLVVDGPFAETKEQFVGFYLVEHKTLEEAIATAERISSPYHSIEIRPVMWSGGALSDMNPVGATPN